VSMVHNLIGQTMVLMKNQPAPSGQAGSRK
jgi:hypothetical protein